MLLNKIFKNAPEIDIKQLSCESRIPMKDCIFFCVKGVKYDGHDYIDEAIKNGANVIIYQDDIDIHSKAIFIKVKSVIDTLIKISNVFYDFPSNSLQSYVTGGSYGKSSVSTILYEILNYLSSCAYIGTYGIKYLDNNLTSNNSTLTILDNQKYFKTFKDSGIKCITLEAVSVGLAYRKLDCITPAAYIYTNTGVNSTDYSRVDTNYIQLQCNYLYSLAQSTVVVLNRDDISYNELSKAAGTNQVSYGKDPSSTYQIMDIKLSSRGSSFAIKENNLPRFINTKLLGETSVYNIAAAYAALRENGYDSEDIIKEISKLEPLEGIMDHGFDEKEYNLLVDNAYSVDSITSVINFVSKITSKKDNIIVVIGIDESKSKKDIEALMKLFNEKVDTIILTSDDSLDFNSGDNIKLASKLLENKRHLLIEDREIAIEEGVKLLNSGDYLVLLGKGKDKFVYKGIDKIEYMGDKELARKYMKIRKDEENEII